ncbi:DNA-dependent metalloprotease SPRTN isoform X1 [Zeugodacus cucurbitae]|uniref:DNA-dependent metalloprotease SPRTN isoform X1 n=1 Tax=Zeugodacus cucurbitae TaxID=28588 RepID=UPI0005969BFF|nr:DNA-dependent metalloprotease SPRTN isoform X1 [Zeugodacus cucurbitae]XP_054087201.1 DNA-dependent metalloprotease SPRTN isoform X1 [Zeugodacus cucurbitae]XP_054087202.1 DNA-dependent metalloprotease SPRTN isoform X1 [Zeugodacus cucurbitae]
MSNDPDFLMALEMQKRWNAESSTDLNSSDGSEPEIVNYSMPPPSKEPLRIKRSNPSSNQDEDYLNRTQNLVHPQWETLDPTPDIFALFAAFDGKFFQSRLKCVTLEWSKRMYSCAGICYSRRNRFGMDITIRLSEPLLKLRPRKDLVETMLHEMIHAYCFVLNIREGNGGHGPNFKKIMYAINKVAGTNITVYHTFHDEVDAYKQHWWRCNGSCQNRAPFFGYVKRTSNRAPGANDQWWAAHQESCGGTFMKIKGPEKPKKQKASKEPKQQQGKDLRTFFPSANKQISSTPKLSDANNVKSFNGGTSGFGGIKGPIKTNGGGTLLLNPKTKAPVAKPIERQTSIASAFPPSSYPGLSSDPFNTKIISGANKTPTRPAPAGGNLKNVIGFANLNSSPGDTGGAAGRVNTNNNANAAFSGSGCQVGATSRSSVSSINSPGREVDRKHLRELWLKRFDKNKTSSGSDTKIENKKKSRFLESDAAAPTGDGKRRRLSSDISQPSDGLKKTKTEDWLVLDDDIMLRDPPTETIAILSDDESGSDDNENGFGVETSKRSTPLTADERHKVIKEEILEDTDDLLDEDIILIDDEYDDNAQDDNNEMANISAAAELADTSVIDEFFGDDTMLKDFNRENDVKPSGSYHFPNPNDDIITCPICQGKMKRCLFADHMDGCTGIAVKIVAPKHLLKKLSTTSRPLNPTRTSRPSRKDILRNAGYSEQDLINLTSTSDDEFNSSSSTINLSSPIRPDANSTNSGSTLEDKDTRLYRQRNILKSTIQCPNCGQEVEQTTINDHLDDCLSP